MKSSRQIAFEVLYKIFYGNAYSNIAVDSALAGIGEGKAFVTRLVYGVVERRITIDKIISDFCVSPKPKVLVILRMGVYQLLFTDKVPTSAAINESVELAKSNGLGYYTGLINAVLRKINNAEIDINAFDDKSLKYSVPVNLINMWNKAYGVETVDAFLPYLNGGAPIFAVPNPLFVTTDELLSELQSSGINGVINRGTVMITSSLDLNNCASFHNGHFHIQDLSCYLAVGALDLRENDTVIDVCSAPGGKSFTAAGFMKNHGKIYALDIHGHRVNLIKSGAQRLKFTSVIPMINDALIYNENLPPADKVICDVPCSGFGIIRRKPEIRYKNLDEIKGLPKIQLEILNTASEYVKPGGKILYSTCTLNIRENEAVIERFLSRKSDFSVTETKTFFPSDSGGDGFFYSILERV